MLTVNEYFNNGLIAGYAFAKGVVNKADDNNQNTDSNTYNETMYSNEDITQSSITSVTVN